MAYLLVYNSLRSHCTCMMNETVQDIRQQTLAADRVSYNWGQQGHLNMNPKTNFKPNPNFDLLTL